MASAQVLPNSGTSSSKKQQQLEAGKKRLEEFRKKKAAAKKAASTGKVHSDDAGPNEKQPSESEHVRVTISDGIGTSDGGGGPVVEENETKATEFVRKADLGSAYDTHATPLFSASNYNAYSADPVEANPMNEERRDHDAPSGSVRDNYGHRDEGKNGNFGSNVGYEHDSEPSTAFHPPSVQDFYSKTSEHSNFMFDEALSKHSNGPLKDFTVVSPVTSQAFVNNISPELSGSIPLLNKSSYTTPLANGPTSSSYEVSSSEVSQSLDGVLLYSSALDHRERKHSSADGLLSSESGQSLWPPESRSTSLTYDIKSSYNQVPPSPAVSGRRARPSFLDSINMPRGSSASSPLTEPEKGNSFSSKVHPMDVASSASQNPRTSFVATSNGSDLFSNGPNELNMDVKHNFYSAKQDEDFAALEQHIEDLTRDKFSLQRALEASRVLAESLATENSALTDSYNQQGGVIHQLKSDMEN